MTDKENIRAEVERLRKLYQLKYQQLSAEDKTCLIECGKRNLCNDLLQFIDSLPEEPVSEDLEEAADEYCNNICNIVEFTEGDSEEEASDREYVEQAFKAGAKWQKQQMMKDAVTLNVTNEFSDNNPEDCVFVIKGKELLEKKYNIGDKVKLLIVKEG